MPLGRTIIRSSDRVADAEPDTANREECSMRYAKLVRTLSAGAAALLCAVSLPALAAGPQVVSGPGADPTCFKPWTDKTKYFKWAKKPGPYRIALANGFIGNTWRIQMIKTAKAYAAQPDVAKELKEFKRSEERRVGK